MGDSEKSCKGSCAMKEFYWTQDKKINIGTLSDWTRSDKEYLDYFFETFVSKKFCQLLNNGIQPKYYSLGFAPEFDVQLSDNTKLEIKISSFVSKNIFIETYKEDNSIGNLPRKKPSGLSVTEADYYILLNPDIVKFNNETKIVVKFRVIPVGVLKELKETHPEISIQGDSITYGFNFEPRYIDDYCLGHYEFDEATKTVNLDKFFTYSKEIKKFKEAYTYGSN